MALTGRFICSLSGIDSSGGFQPSFDAIIQGLGYATPPIMALLFILDDVSPHARAIKDVEDEERRSFFYGMSPWQFIVIVAASSVGEELFCRAVVQVLFLFMTSLKRGQNQAYRNGLLRSLQMGLSQHLWHLVGLMGFLFPIL